MAPTTAPPPRTLIEVTGTIASFEATGKGAMDDTVEPATEAETIARGIVGAVAPDGVLEPAQASLLGAVFDSLFECSVDLLGSTRSDPTSWLSPSPTATSCSGAGSSSTWSSQS